MSFMLKDYGKQLPAVIELAKAAGKEIMQIYDSKRKFDISYKPDNSPLTEADLIAHEVIVKGLREIAPDVPILSEEAADIPYSERQGWQQYWLVDPLDGTGEFISRSGQFTVNIALIEDQKVVLGVTYAPVAKACFYAAVGFGAHRLDDDGRQTRIKTRKVQAAVEVIVSKQLGASNLQLFLDQLDSYRLRYFGGSLKICLVAEGVVDIYPRLGSNCEWDTASGQIILEEAGGALIDLDGRPLHYNTKDSLYNPFFMVIGDQSFPWRDYLKFLKKSDVNKDE